MRPDCIPIGRLQSVPMSDEKCRQHVSLLTSNSFLLGLDICLCLAREKALYSGESREVTRAIRARRRESERRRKTGRILRFLFDRQKWRACSHANMRHQCLPSELGKVDGNMESKMCFFMFCFDDFLSTSLSLR